jgi:hypothetical protein
MKDFILKTKTLISENKQLTITIAKGIIAIMIFIISVAIFLVYLGTKEDSKTNDEIENKEEIEDEENENEVEETGISWEEFKTKYNLIETERLELAEMYENKYVKPLLVKTFEIENLNFNTLRIPEVTFSDDLIEEMKENNLKKYNDAIKYIDDVIAVNEAGEDNGGMPIMAINYHTYTKGDLFSIIMNIKAGWMQSSYEEYYNIYNLDGAAKRNITDEELLSKLNITREEFNEELITKVRNQLMTQVFFYYDVFSETDTFNEQDVIDTYNQILDEKNTWKIFIDQDQGLSVLVPVSPIFETAEFMSPFIVKVIDNI